MNDELTSEGKCFFCNELFSQQTIGKHLASHLSKMEKDDKEKGPETFCHILVDQGEMFIHLLVKGAATMKKIDIFLQKI